MSEQEGAPAPQDDNLERQGDGAPVVQTPSAAEGGETGASAAAMGPQRLTAVYDVPVQISAVLGRASMPVGQLLRLGRGAVVELDRKVGEPVDVYVNNRLIARGEVMIVDDHLGITMTEIIKSEQ